MNHARQTVQAFLDALDINMGGVKAFSAGWYQLEDGKIKTVKVLFDPRPVLEAPEWQKK